MGGYRVERRLGEGAAGIVYAAPGGVAVKVLRPEVAADEELRARFAREARLAGEIRSRHVAPVLEVGDGYLVMPLYAESLAERLRRGPLGADATAGLAAQLARGLDALHKHGFVHRDVKPSNVLFEADGTAAIADFGLARGSGSTRLTLDGQLLGTPLYLAPELIEGRDATPASDVYALGCVLYECATGAPPFTARHLAELGFAHLTEPPPDPREREPGLAADFALALLTALEKEPAARPTTATALARMLHTAARV